MSDTDDRTFRLGITMAGAVSAGAYTAGVLDVLLQALAEQAAAEDALPVVLKALSGTSAGGVCTALTVPALLGGVGPGTGGQGGAESGAGSILRRLWVEEIDMLPGAGRAGLTSTTDLDATRDAATPGPVFSALDTAAIDEAARRVLAAVTASGRRHDWVAADLDLFITCTNLAGVPYRVPFSARELGDGHRMANHAYVAHFRVTGLGTAEIGSPWLERWKDRGRLLDLAHPAGTAVSFVDGDLRPLLDMGLVTGAFPFGLAARVVATTPNAVGLPDLGDLTEEPFLTGGAWPLEIDPEDGRIVCEHGDLGCHTDFRFVGVDGGVCNNEPFELARFTLRAASTADGRWRLLPNPREPDRADRAVIMIDPFPEGPEALRVEAIGDADRAMTAILGGLQEALVNQARFKPGELVAAAAPEGRSRFLVAPSREDGNGTRHRGAHALASGFLGGFGGFFDRAFRAHDYDLGRHNAQSFLSRHFRLSPDNPVLQGRRQDHADPETGEIPILNGAPSVFGEKIEQPAWPRLPLAEVDRIFEAVGGRLDAVKARLLLTDIGGWVMRRLASAGWSLVGRRRLMAIFERSALAELVARDQIEETRDLTPTERRVLGALIGPGPELRTARWLAERLKPATAESAPQSLVDAVTTALAGLEGARGPGRRLKLWHVREAEATYYALEAYKPRSLFMMPVLRGPVRWAFGDVSRG